MLQVTKFMVERLVAGKGTTVKDVASKFKAKNADVIGMLEAVIEDGEMVLAIDTPSIMAKTQLAIVKLDLGIAQEYGITEQYVKPAGFEYFKDVEGKMTQTLEAGKHKIEIDVDDDGSSIDGTGDNADGEGAVSDEDWYVPTEKPVTTGRKTKTPEQMAALAAAKAQKAADREKAKLDRAALSAAKLQEKAANQGAAKVAREAKKAERDAAKAANRVHDGDVCLVCHKPLTAENNAIRGIGLACLKNLAEFSKGLTVAELSDPSLVDESELKNLVAGFEAYKTENRNGEGNRKSYTTEAEALAAHPEGIVKIADVWNALKDAKISPLRMMKASGGEFGVGQVLNPTWEIFTIGKTRRYFSANVMSSFNDLIPDKLAAQAEEA